MRPLVIAAGLFAIALVAPAIVSTTADASHTKRIVMPYGQNERWIPIVAGYEVAPKPLGCDAGTVTPTTTIYEQDFEGDTSDVVIAKNILQVDDPRRYFNPFHVTHAIANERGTDEGHSGTGKLYFGNSETGKMYRVRMGGTVSFPSFVVPSEPTFMAWNDKFEVEGLWGYDHFWVELVDHTDGRVYILCSTDTEVRPDKSSTDNTFSTCSPYRTMLCPVGIHGHGGLNAIGCVPPFIPVCIPTGLGWLDFSVLGAERIDPTAPHWESRYVQVPDVFAGREVTLRFSADSSDGVANGYLGWMADDVLIATGTPLPEPYAYVVPVPRDVPGDV